MSETTSPRAGLTRRSFLKTTGAVAGAAALTGAAVPTLTALAATTDTVPAAEEQVFYSNCGGNCGGPFCRMKGIVREGKLVQVRPADVDPDHPTFKTGCVKGQTGPQRLYGPKRNLYPLKRVGERGAGEWERISWDEAIATIAEKMKNAQAQYGDSSIAFWHSYVGGGSVLNYATSSCLPGGVRMGTSVSLERFVQKTGATVMAPAADKTLQWAIASIPGLAKFAPQSDLPKAKTILIWGANPPEHRAPTSTSFAKRRRALEDRHHRPSAAQRHPVRRVPAGAAGDGRLPGARHVQLGYRQRSG